VDAERVALREEPDRITPGRPFAAGRQATADPNNLRVAFEIGESGFDPAKVTDNYSAR
jgi:hypothetical protein